MAVAFGATPPSPPGTLVVMTFARVGVDLGCMISGAAELLAVTACFLSKLSLLGLVAGMALATPTFLKARASWVDMEFKSLASTNALEPPER